MSLFSDLQPTQAVDENCAATGGFVAIGAKNGANECYTKARAVATYQLDVSGAGAIQDNQLLPKSYWVNGIAPSLPVGSFNNTIDDIWVQNDGKVLIGGRFTAYNSLTRNYLLRLNADGTEDAAFYANLGTGFNNYVYALVSQPDGKILVGGAFITLNGVTRNRLVRLNADGTVDATFYANLGAGFNNQINTIALQNDGKILAGGTFTTFNGATRNYLVRLNSDGTEDVTFYTTLGSGFDSYVNSVALTSTNFEIYVGGRFVTANGTPINRFCRLLGNGQNDVSFNFNMGTGVDNEVYDMSVQPDNSVVIVGEFTNVRSTPRWHVAKVNYDGTDNPGWYSGFGNYWGRSGDITFAVCTQPNGRILIGGVMSIQHVETVKQILALNANGTIDTAYMTNLGTGFDGLIRALRANPNGRVHVGGQHLNFNGLSRPRYAVTNNNGTDAMI